MKYFVNKQLKRFNLLVTEIDAAYHDAALRLGLSDSALLILYTLCWCNGECLLSDITASLSKQTVNSALRKLEADNMIYLQPFEGRKKKLCLTDKGYHFVKDTVYRLIEIENLILGSWTNEEKNTYVELTQRYLTAFREKIQNL